MSLTTLAMVGIIGDVGLALYHMAQALVVRHTRPIFARSDPS